MTSLKRSLILATASAVALGACTTDPNDPNRNTQQGLLLGGALGAAAGAIAGNNPEERRRNAVAGAIIGGAAGGITGSILDRQERELRQQFDDDRISITNTGDRLIVTMPNGILFDTDSAAVRPGLRGDLSVLAQSLQRYPDSAVQVIGHTDNTGEAAYNQRLSERRAEAVASTLVTDGVRPQRLRIIGRGEDQPVASNLTPEGRQQNRRVEVVIIPTT
ncbi:OmpA family protein [Rhodosalinus sp. K401]|uniref:OmpA family protein n=1 Tax=Rhodosalinus sp. K401 TaxID=3239195 RepID=UPI003524B990